MNDNQIFKTVELDNISSAILNSLNAQIAILDSEGIVVAHNLQWKIFSDENKEHWNHPKLDENILSFLQRPLAEGNDFALRLLLGIKEVLNGEKKTFETKYQPFLHNQTAHFNVKINSLGSDEGAVIIYEDISAEVLNREYLKETKEKLNKHFQNSLYGILTVNEKNQIIEANETACNILEASNEALLFSDVSSYLSIGLSHAEIQKRINRHGNSLGEFEIKTANNKTVPIELSVSLFRNINGETVTSWAFKNITERKETQEALKASEQQYKLQFNNTLEGTIIGRPDGQILKVNPAVCDILGYKAEELEGQHRDLVFDLSNPMNAEAISKRSDSGSFIGEVEFTHKDGHKIPVEVSSVIFEAEDETQKTIINIRDISSQKAIQQQLVDEKEFTESAISSLPTAFFVFNLKGEMIRWNQMLEEDLGYSREEIEQTNVIELVYPDDRPILQNIMSGELVGNKLSVEARCITKDGGIVHYLLKGTSFEQNNERYIVGGGLNRSDFKEIEKEKLLVSRELQRTQTFNELAVNSANIGLWEVDMQTGEAYYNDRWYKMLGYKEEEIEFNRAFFLSLLHPDDKDIPDEELKRYRSANDKYEAEFRVKAKNGEYRWIMAVAEFASFDDGKDNSTKLAGSHTDITERKKAEIEVKRNQQLLNQLFFNSPIGIVLVDADGSIQNTNHSFNSIFGYSNGELTGKSLDDTIVPKKMNEQGEKLSRLSFTGDSFQTETTRINKNGEEVPVLVGGVPVEFDGEVIAIYGMYVDITKRKELENKIVHLLEMEKRERIQMQDMFEGSPSAIAMLEGKDHTYTFVNNKYKELVSRDELIGLPVLEAIPELANQGFIELLDNSYESDQTLYFNEREVYFNKGENGDSKKHYLNFVYKPIHNDQGETYGIFVEAIDVTEQVEARNIIEKSLQEKDTLLNEVHHRVKNNLAIVSGLVDLEIIENSDPKFAKHLNSTRSRITAIAKIHELLYQNESLSHVSFKKYIQSVIGEVSSLFKERAFTLAADLGLDEVELNVNQAIPAGMLLNEILDYLDYICENNSGDDKSELLISMTNNVECVKIELKNPDNNLLPLYNSDEDPNTDLRKELIKVLLKQIHGEVKLSSDPESTLSIHFAKSELKGPHSGL
ncbi:MAG: hypothetical protein CL670_07700 [Balneola sp.]|jgi:PAS domain S-box-containing protein|nr:hypothetical protein [Balneola sp.]MBE79021.1 hypothetical protein [Balneola sp.]|tara:strand:+ start:1774 stop:5157 length:3384 start_codon:yes stop_codon:yes gene_type:complete